MEINVLVQFKTAVHSYFRLAIRYILLQPFHINGSASPCPKTVGENGLRVIPQLSDAILLSQQWSGNGTPSGIQKGYVSVEKISRYALSLLIFTRFQSDRRRSTHHGKCGVFLLAMSSANCTRRKRNQPAARKIRSFAPVQLWPS